MTARIATSQARRARRFLMAGFAILGTLLVLAAWFGVLERDSTGNALSVVATQRLITDSYVEVAQAESGQRGYLLTGNPAYLAPYFRSQKLLPLHLGQLRSALAGSQSLPDLLNLQAEISKKMAEMAQTIALCQGGNRAAAMELVQTNAGLNAMDQIRTLAHTMQLAQDQHLAKIDVQTQRTGALFLAAALLSAIAVFVLALFTITDNREQTNQVLVLNAELTRIFALSADILKVSDASGTIRSVSPAWAQVTGIPTEEAIGKPLQEFVHPDDLAQTEAIFDSVRAGGGMQRFENRLRHADGSYRWLAWRAVPLPEEGLTYSIGRDVTEEKAREEQLRQSQKMDVLGQLTGGIAHDFNNLLTVIMGSLELLQRKLPGDDPKITRRVDAAMDGARRAASLTHRMLAFARRQPLDPQIIDANKVVSGMSELLHRVLGEHIALEIVCGAGLWRVLADGHQLENAILNLAVNARDAMQSGGRLTIETHNVVLDGTYAAAEADVTPGQYALIAVTDLGAGMSPETVEKAFEPFFTTKPVGQGTGLGLPQVYGFIKQSNGHIKIYSELGQGTSVKLYLPRLIGAETIVQAPTADSEPAELDARGEVILVVEDEENVRKFTVEILREFGYRVIGAENAATAIPIIESETPIDLMFTDVVLTGELNGRQLADVLLRRRPATKVLFTTGYTRNAIIHHGRLDEGTEFLGKPFSAADLGQKIRKVLDQR